MQTLSKRRLWIGLVLLTVSVASAASNPAAKKLVGAWKATIDYKTHVVTFLNGEHMELDGEIHDYTI